MVTVMAEEICVKKTPQVELKITCPLCLDLRRIFISKEDFEGFIHSKIIKYAVP